jgi:hypothetical protein
MLECFEKFSEATLGGLPGGWELPVEPSNSLHTLRSVPIEPEGDSNHVVPCESL